MTDTGHRRVVMDPPDDAFRLEGGSGWLRVEPLPDAGLPRLSRQLIQLSPGSPVIWPAPGGPPDLRLYVDLEPGAALVPSDPAGFDRPGDVAHIEAMVEALAVMLQPAVPGAGVEKRLTPDQPFETEEPCGVSAVTTPLWVMPGTETVRYGDLAALPALATERFAPLTRTLWLAVPAYTRLTCATSETLSGDGTLVASFRQFLTLALYQVYETYSDQYVKDFMRLDRGVRNQKKRMAATLASAASVLSGEHRSGTGESPMFEAVSRVCDNLGCEPVRPERLPEDPREQLDSILAASGMTSRRISLWGNWYRRDCGPILAFQKGGPGTMGRPVALIREKGRYRCHIPGKGARRLTRRLRDELKPAGIQLYPDLPEGGVTLGKLFRFCFKGRAGDAAAVAWLGLAAALCAVVPPVAVTLIVDRVIPGGDLPALTLIVAALLLASLGSTLFELTKGAALIRLQAGAGARLQSAAYARLLRLPIRFFRQYTAGELTDRFRALESIQAQLSAAVIAALVSGVFGLGNLILMAVYAWPLALGVCGLLALILAAALLMAVGRVKAVTRMQAAAGQLSSMELQMVTGIAKLRTAGAESRVYARWMQVFTRLRRLSFGLETGAAGVAVFTSLLPSAAVLLVFTVYALLEPEVTLARFLGFNTALGQLAASVASLCTTGLALVPMLPTLKRAAPLLDTPAEAPGEQPGRLNGDIAVKNVSFAYPGQPDPVLRDVSLSARPGEFVAIVGASGSGKSTLMKLLLGFHAPLSGAVLYDGTDLARLDPVRVRRQIGTVIQNGDLLQGDIAINITGADPVYRGKDIWRAARQARVDEDIWLMPMQFHTVVPHGGGTFSGGQQQRIMLARALYRRPGILFLDEATSSLDNRTQAAVMESLERLQATRIVVAHRLSTVEKADRIYVLENGRVAEEGAYGDLMAAKGLFHAMARRQQI